MKLLTLSDIHGHLPNVQVLRSQETNDYDLVLVAGDIGSDEFSEVLEILNTFDCPIYYVYGNWDTKLPYDPAPIGRAELLHLQIKKLGQYYFTGFSGCETSWGLNPIYQKELARIERSPASTPERRRVSRVKTAKLALQKNRQRLFDLIRATGVPEDRLVVMTHERLTRMAEVGVAPLLHVFGHQHRHRLSHFKRTTYLNTSAIQNDLQSQAVPRQLAPGAPPPEQGYCRVTLSNGEVEVERVKIDG